MNLVGVAEAARQLGLNKSTVSRQVARGIIPNRGTRAEPLVDVDEARQARATTLNPLKARNRGGQLGYERSLDEAGALLDRAGENDPGERRSPEKPQTGLGMATLAEKAVRAQLLQLELEVKRGIVCDVAGVEAGAAAAVQALHDALRQRNRELAARLARMADPAAIEAALTDSDRGLLERWAAVLNQKIGTDDDQQQAA